MTGVQTCALPISRKDQFDNIILTTFDIRLTTPNKEPVLNTAENHTIEHIGATFLRNHPMWKDRIVYFGPMGCRTGFYLIVFGEYSSSDIYPLVNEMFTFIADFEGEIPGAKADECGNYLDQNLEMAKWISRKYIALTLSNIDEAHLNYPE